MARITEKALPAVTEIAEQRQKAHEEQIGLHERVDQSEHRQ